MEYCVLGFIVLSWRTNLVSVPHMVRPESAPTPTEAVNIPQLAPIPTEAMTCPQSAPIPTEAVVNCPQSASTPREAAVTNRLTPAPAASRMLTRTTPRLVKPVGKRGISSATFRARFFHTPAKRHIPRTLQLPRTGATLCAQFARPEKRRYVTSITRPRR